MLGMEAHATPWTPQMPRGRVLILEGRRECQG